MITFDAFLVFLFASSLPICYIMIMRHFIEGGQSANEAGTSAASSKVRKQANDRSSYFGHSHDSLSAAH